jgi:hypothetical protein
VVSAASLGAVLIGAAEPGLAMAASSRTAIDKNSVLFIFMIISFSNLDEYFYRIDPLTHEAAQRKCSDRLPAILSIHG